jgi:hypothetical protein
VGITISAAVSCAAAYPASGHSGSGHHIGDGGKEKARFGIGGNDQKQDADDGRAL